MYVCICHGVSDKQIIESVDNGNTTVKGVAKDLKVATQCGKCANCTKQIIENRLIEIADLSPKVA